MARNPQDDKPKFSPTARWLRTVRAANGLDQDEFGRYIGKGRSTIAAYEGGTRNIPKETVAEIRTAFPESPAPPTSGDLEVLGSATGDGLYSFIRYAGIVPCSSQWGDPLESKEKLPISPEFAGEDRFLCRVGGDSCHPALQQGDITIWKSDPAPPYGVIVLAELEEDASCTVKVLERGDRPNEPRLVPVNPDFEEPPNNRPWHVSARLVAVIRDSDGPKRSIIWEPGLKKEHLMLQFM
jgi:transcriptional regulator with XRE-family HTH domain